MASGAERKGKQGERERDGQGGQLWCRNFPEGEAVSHSSIPLGVVGGNSVL